jgi:hypothetical protein
MSGTLKNYKITEKNILEESELVQTHSQSAEHEAESTQARLMLTACRSATWQLDERNISQMTTEVKKKYNNGGRPRKTEACNKRISIGFTANEYKRILQKAGSFDASTYLKILVLNSLENPENK